MADGFEGIRREPLPHIVIYALELGSETPREVDARRFDLVFVLVLCFHPESVGTGEVIGMWTR